MKFQTIQIYLSNFQSYFHPRIIINFIILFFLQIKKIHFIHSHNFPIINNNSFHNLRYRNPNYTQDEKYILFTYIISRILIEQRIL